MRTTTAAAAATEGAVIETVAARAIELEIGIARLGDVGREARMGTEIVAGETTPATERETVAKVLLTLPSAAKATMLVAAAQSPATEPKPKTQR